MESKDKKRPIIAVLTGAGISQESGIATFRGGDGLWENHRIEDVASPEGWRRNRNLVLKFYNERRKKLFEVEPNAAHFALRDLEKAFDVQIITQNVDDLHERAGSKNVLHLHGELRKVRSAVNPDYVLDWTGDLTGDEKCPNGAPLRPHIVWFGEDVPLLYSAAKIVSEADLVVIIGTSMQVYPAAGLSGCARPDVPICYIDPYPQPSTELKKAKNKRIVAERATVGVPDLVANLLQLAADTGGYASEAIAGYFSA